MQLSKEEELEFLDNMLKWNESLLKDPVLLGILTQKRGINRDTVVTTGFGIDTKKGLWTIPTFGYHTDGVQSILGFEYRPFDFSKKGLHRTKGTPNGMAMINCYTPNSEALCIVEGYFDGYALLQYLTEQGAASYYHICTPSNGVTSLPTYMPEIDFNKYKKFYLYIDNDDAGNTVADRILENYPMFERIIMNCGCKDFNEHYLKCIKAS